MDWNSKEGRALLWKAYPDGYLAKRGVLTLGGWMKTVSGWVDGGAPHRGIEDQRSRGLLLPLPDPTDTATWACLLQDLAEAVNSYRLIGGRVATSALYTLYGGLSLRSNASFYWMLCDAYGRQWQWQCQRDSAETVVTSHGSYPVWKADLAEALVTLRAYERECAAAAAR